MQTVGLRRRWSDGCCVIVHDRFRNGFKYVFRWLPCVTWHASDALGICGTAKIVRLGAAPSDGNVAAGALTTMYRSPRDCRRGMSATQQTLMTQTHADSAERIDCCAAVGGAISTSSAASGHRQSAVGLQLYTVTPASAAASHKRQKTSPRTREDSF